MNRSQLLSVLVASLSIVALGIAATTAETTLTTDPQDEVNPDWDRLPLGEENAAGIQREIAGDDPAADAADDAADADDVNDDGFPTEPADPTRADGVGGAGGIDAADPVPGGSDAERDGEMGASTNGGAGGGSGADSGSADGMGDGDPSAMDNLLAALLGLLSALVPVLVFLLIGAIAYRYRTTLLSILADDTSRDPESVGSKPDVVWPTAEPETVVDRAWASVMRQVEPERPETTTTGDCLALARERGVAIEHVETILTAFDRVHYGGCTVESVAEGVRAAVRALEGEKPE